MASHAETQVYGSALPPSAMCSMDIGSHEGRACEWGADEWLPLLVKDIMHLWRCEWVSIPRWPLQVHEMEEGGGNLRGKCNPSLLQKRRHNVVVMEPAEVRRSSASAQQGCSY